MLGFYDNFPENVHETALFAISISTKRLQQTLIRMFQETNTKTFNLEDIADPSVPQCTVNFELGIAEANNFNYLDNEEANKALNVLQKKPFQIMDFYCGLRYHKMQNKKKTSLKFDYYMARFTFNKDHMEIRIFHERGPRYVSPKDMVSFFVDKINEAFSKKILKSLKPS